MIRPALTILTTVLLFGCGGGGSDGDPTPSVSSMDDISVRKAGIDLINIVNESIDFYVKQTSDSSQLFDGNNKVATVLDNDGQYHSISWTTSTPTKVNIGVTDTNSQTFVNQVDDVLLNNSEKLWAVSWADSGDLMLSTDLHTPSPVAEKYRIRIFTTKDTQVLTLSSAMSTIEVKKGTFSPHMTLDNCNGELYLGANSADVCNLDIGKSYLLVTDGEHLLLAAEE
ncbi:hypothetical protein [Photobacterium ganghwense]|nr:hypothetical protein [Photobacterium ganghwense]MBV1839871.1 hypothetical protein [Photobacterium ganghwense]QSV12903.1 hypothetical protein FH974_08955 [Photobacterium ganghwense]